MRKDDLMVGKIYQYELDNGDKVIYDIRQVKDARYKDGIMYTALHVRGRKDPVRNRKLARQAARPLAREERER